MVCIVPHGVHYDCQPLCRNIKIALKCLFSHIEQPLKCLTICFHCQGIHLLHQIQFVVCNIPHGVHYDCRPLCLNTKIALKCLSGHIEQPLKCLTICFHGQGIHLLHQIQFVVCNIYPMEYIIIVDHYAETLKSTQNAYLVT